MDMFDLNAADFMAASKDNLFQQPGYSQTIEDTSEIAGEAGSRLELDMRCDETFCRPYQTARQRDAVVAYTQCKIEMENEGVWGVSVGRDRDGAICRSLLSALQVN